MYVFLLTTDTVSLSRMAEGNDSVVSVFMKIIVVILFMGTSPFSVTFAVVGIALRKYLLKEVDKDHQRCRNCSRMALIFRGSKISRKPFFSLSTPTRVRVGASGREGAGRVASSPCARGLYVTFELVNMGTGKA